MKRIVFFILLAWAFFAERTASAEGIKLALIAPEGSTWVNIMKDMSAELAQKTAGRWELKLYTGGVMGDEKVVIKKMQIGQVDAAGFTGVGLGEIYPAIRVLELPFLFNSPEEIDFVVGRLLPNIQAGFSGKGYEFLGWAESGFVHIFSNKLIRGLADMEGVRMWMWQGDPLAEKMYQVMGIVPVPLDIPDVLMALQTNMINGVYAPPLGAVALQWFSKTRYMSDARLVNSIGAILITKKAFARMTPADQAVLKDVSARYSKKLVDSTRRDNQKAIDALKSSGVTVVDIDAKNLDELTAKSRRVWTELAGTLYPRELLDKTTGYVEEYRKKR